MYWYWVDDHILLNKMIEKKMKIFHLFLRNYKQNWTHFSHYWLCSSVYFWGSVIDGLPNLCNFGTLLLSYFCGLIRYIYFYDSVFMAIFHFLTYVTLSSAQFWKTTTTTTTRPNIIEIIMIIIITDMIKNR